MKRTLSSLVPLLICFMATAQTLEKAPSGIKLYIEAQNITEEISFYDDQIVRVVKYPGKERPQKKSYSVIMESQATDFSISESDGNVLLTTAGMQVIVNEKTGKLAFRCPEGRSLLEEKEYGADFVPCMDGPSRSFKVSQDFLLERGEVIYGLGQQQTGLMSQRNQELMLRNENTRVCIPYITSEKGYGVYWDNPSPTVFTDTEQNTSFESSAGHMVDYYFMYGGGSQDALIACIRELSGQATMLPLWTMGFWQCRERYKSSDELCEVLDTYRKLEIPIDGIVQDWQYWGCDSNWNAMKFMNPRYINKIGDPQWMKYLPDNEDPSKLSKKEPRIKSPEEMVEYVHKNNAHIMISIWASFGPWTDQYRELKEMNALLPFDTWPLNRGVMAYDPFNPEARDLYWRYLKHLYDMGFDAWWTDSTEPDRFNMTEEHYSVPTADGTFRSVHNAFPLMSNMGIYENQRAISDAKRLFLMTRSSSFGQQRYGSFCWSGDVISDWPVMRAQIAAGLNYSLCGIPYWNTDIGGFFGWAFRNDWKDIAFKELQVRWMQWGCFMPIMRNHASSPMETEIYKLGNPGEWTFDAQKKFVELRYRLMPYIYSLCGEVTRESGSIMRPFIMDFPADRKAITLDNEYMFGHSLLVAPVTEPLYTSYDYDTGKSRKLFENTAAASESVEVYLPEGARWYDFWDNTIAEGGQTVTRECPIDIMPVYVKAGSIIPFGPAVQYVSEKKWDNLEIRIYPGADAEFVLYEDEGDSYNYEKGAFSLIRFNWDDASRTLTISDREGNFDGMLKNRSFRVIVVGNDSPSGDKEPARFDRKIRYNGKKTTIKL